MEGQGPLRRRHCRLQRLGSRTLCTLPARLLDFYVSLSLAVNELDGSVVLTERWHGLSGLR